MMKENYPEDVYENAEKETMQNLKNKKEYRETLTKMKNLKKENPRAAKFVENQEQIEILPEDKNTVIEILMLERKIQNMLNLGVVEVLIENCYSVKAIRRLRDENIKEIEDYSSKELINQINRNVKELARRIEENR